MPTYLHLSRGTPQAILDEVASAVTGIRIDAAFRARAGHFRDALLAASSPGHERYCSPLRELRRNGFDGISTILPDGYDTVAEYITDYLKKSEPTIWKYEEFLRKGLGKFKGTDYAKQHDLNLLDEIGSTEVGHHVIQLFKLQKTADPKAAAIPEQLSRVVTGLYWE